VLTTQLAETLELTPGQMLTVEVLEGIRPARQIPVAGVIDELIGVSAYMDIRALNRLMREGPTISGAYLTVDPQRVGQLYTLLKRTPAVAGVSLRQAALTGFEDTIGTSLGVFTLVGFLVFAFLPAPVQVDLESVERGALIVTVDAEGKTRVRYRSIVSAPVTGRLSRIALHEGDRVEQGGRIARIDPLPHDAAVREARAHCRVTRPAGGGRNVTAQAAVVVAYPGARVRVEDWGSDTTLHARVRLVEPSACTKVSALGVEEQRVNVIADFLDAPVPLGDGYRVEARIVIWQGESVLTVPLSALFRCGES
jgi:hypothetical protein